MALTRRQERNLNDALEEEQERYARRGIRAGVSRVLRRIARRILRLEVEEVVSVVESGGDGVSFALEASQSDWPRRWASELEAPLEEAAVEAGERVAEAVGGDPLPPSMREWLSQYTSELAQTLSGTTYENVRRTIEEGQAEGLGVRDVARRLREREPEISKYRSELIARTELHRSSVGAGFFQAKQAGATTKTWTDSDDERVRMEHSALDGVTIGIDEEFPGEGQFPQAVACRCVLTFGVD